MLKKRERRPAVGLYLSTLESCAWLDDEKDWLAFRGGCSRAARLVRRVLTVAPAIELARLVEALSREPSMKGGRLPEPIMREFCRRVIGCEISGKVVRSATSEKERLPAARAKIVGPS